MITGQLRSRSDRLWEEFWTGGITNPLTVIEQISFLMFARLLDMRESTEQKKFDRVNRGKNKKFPGLFFKSSQQHMRWSQFKHRGGDEMLKIIRDELFPHFRNLGSNGKGGDDPKNTFAEYMKDATLMIQKPSLLVSAVNMIDELPLTRGDTKGDLYEYLLSKLTTAGINGQFRTPRHIIRLMVDLMLHGVDTPDIHYQDTLSNNFPEKFPKMASDGFDLIMANPPFKGSLDYSDVHSSLTGKVKTKKTELLFVVLMLRMLKQGGRCAVVVPDGVLFGSSKAHKSLREMLIEQHQLEAVVKLPAGVFKPYAGVSTAILFFTKDGRTTDVWFYDVQADGYSLDDKRDRVEENDLPDVRKRWAKRNPKKDTDRTAKASFVPKQEIAENGYDLSINRYKEIVHEEVEYDPPNVILRRLKRLEAEIAQDLEELEVMLEQ